MLEDFLQFLRCPVSGSPLHLQRIATAEKRFGGQVTEYISEALLWAPGGLCYPVIRGVPRLIAEAIIDYEWFFLEHVPDFRERKKSLATATLQLLRVAAAKNKKTKQSFALEWSLFRYGTDRTWDADLPGMIDRFLKETDETPESLHAQLVLDVGCGHGLLDSALGKYASAVLAMDLSLSVEKAFEQNEEKNVLFIQGDLAFPPVSRGSFDIVHCSGVLIHTSDTHSSFDTVESCTKTGGKLSVWIYHPRKDRLHRLFNRVRHFTSTLPLKVQYYLYLVALFPVSYLIKKIKGNRQNSREIMISILDWFTPEHRWEHEQAEVREWFGDKNYRNVKVTTDELFGFNMTGEKTSFHTPR